MLCEKLSVRLISNGSILRTERNELRKRLLPLKKSDTFIFCAINYSSSVEAPPFYCYWKSIHTDGDTSRRGAAKLSKLQWTIQQLQGKCAPGVLFGLSFHAQDTRSPQEKKRRTTLWSCQNKTEKTKQKKPQKANKTGTFQNCPTNWKMTFWLHLTLRVQEEETLPPSNLEKTRPQSYCDSVSETKVLVLGLTMEGAVILK